MAIQVTVHWHLAADRELDLSYQVGPVGPSGPWETWAPEEQAEERPVDRVLPLGSSVLTPGLSMPLPA